MDRFIDGMNLAYVEYVVAFKRPNTFDDAEDKAFLAEEVALKKRAICPKRSSSSYGEGHQEKKMKSVASGFGQPNCDTCGKRHKTEMCWKNTGACLSCGSMEHLKEFFPRSE